MYVVEATEQNFSNGSWNEDDRVGIGKANKHTWFQYLQV